MTPIPLVDLQAQDAAVGPAVRAAVERVAGSQRFILASEVRELESELAQRFGVAAAVGVANGSDALFLALLAAGVGPGHEVITTALSFFATAGAIARTGARPVFVDLEAEGYALDPARVEAAASPRTRAIVPVHLYGRCAAMESIVAIAAKHGWTVIEDAAQAIDATRHGRAAGSFGEFGALSFHPTKNLGGWGDGGMVLCRSEEGAAAIARLRAHGGEGGVHDAVGINSRLDELQAAILRAKLPHLAAWGAARRERAERYRRRLREAELGDEVRWFGPDSDGVEVVHHFVVRCRRRDALRAHLNAQGIGAGIYYPRPLHLQPCFAALGGREGDCPNAEAAAREVLSLPLYPELTDDQMDAVVSAMDTFHRGAGS